MSQKKLTLFTAWPQISSPQNSEERKKKLLFQWSSLWYFQVAALATDTLVLV